MARRDQHGDVAAIVDIGALEAGDRLRHRAQHGVGDGPGDGGHRRDELLAKEPAGARHAPCRRAGQRRRLRPERLAQHPQFAGELGQQAVEGGLGGGIGALDFGGSAEGRDDEIARALLQMQAVARQAGDAVGCHPTSLPVIASAAKQSRGTSSETRLDCFAALAMKGHVSPAAAARGSRPRRPRSGPGRHGRAGPPRPGRSPRHGRRRRDRARAAR